MLGYIEEDLREAMGIDVEIAMPITTMFGDSIDNAWKEWRTHWGQTVLLPAAMQVEAVEGGGFVVFPQGDKNSAPCARMPESGYFFDAIIRQEEFDEDDPDPEDNTQEFGLLHESELARLAEAAKQARAGGRAVVAGLPGTALGDISLVPGMNLKKPKGIRDIEEWYISTSLRPEFIKKVFERQVEIALENLPLIYKAVGDAYDAVFVCGTDFGTQISTFCSKEAFDNLYLPFYQKINGWIHDHTPWKTLET